MTVGPPMVPRADAVRAVEMALREKRRNGRAAGLYGAAGGLLLSSLATGITDSALHGRAFTAMTWLGLSMLAASVVCYALAIWIEDRR